MKSEKSKGFVFWSGSVDEVLKIVGADPSAGLTQDEAKRRLKKYGINKIYAESRESALRYISYVASDLTLILLLITAAIAAVFGERASVALIIPILIFSILVRTYAYIRARRYLEACSSASAVMPSIAVLRGGSVYRIDLRRVVTGDIIRLHPGDIVPCDCRIISSDRLSVYDAFTTGGIGPVSKYPCELPADTVPSACHNVCFAGSSVFTGSAVAVAVETGADTLAVRARGGIKTTRGGELKLTRLLERYSRIWGAAMTAAVFIITVLKLIMGGEIYGVFFSGLALAVASMCEYYSAMGDIAAAGGLSALSRGGGGWHKSGAFMRTIKSIEALSEIETVIFGCDGVVTADGVCCAFSYFRGKTTGGAEKDIENTKDIKDTEDEKETECPYELCRLAALSVGIYRKLDTAPSDGGIKNGADIGQSESTSALAEYIAKNNISTDDIYGEAEPVLYRGRRDGLSFDTQLLYEDGGYVAYMSGGAREIIASSVLLELEENGEVVSSPLSDQMRARLLSAVSYYERRGAEIIAVAKKNTPFHSPEKMPFTQLDVTFLGLFALLRPTAPDIEGAIEACRRAGIRLIMTGNGRRSALTAQRVGIISGREDILTEREFISMSESEAAEAARSKSLLLNFGCRSLYRFLKLTGSGGRHTAYVGDASHDIPSEIRLLRSAGASFALSHERPSQRSGDERLITDETLGVSQTLKLQADNIIPRATGEGGGLPCIIDSAAYSKRIFKNISNIAGYLVTSQTARLFCVLYSIIARESLLTAEEILIWGLIFDFFAVIALAFEIPDYTTLSYKPDVYERLAHPLSGIGIPAAYGALWASLTMLAPKLYGSADMSGVIIFVSVILSFSVVCGEMRCDVSLFSWRRRLNIASAVIIIGAPALIVLLTVSRSVSDALMLIQPDAKALLISAVPASVLLFVYELARFKKDADKR